MLNCTLWQLSHAWDCREHKHHATVLFSRRRLDHVHASRDTLFSVVREREMSRVCEGQAIHGRVGWEMPLIRAGCRRSSVPSHLNPPSLVRRHQNTFHCEIRLSRIRYLLHTPLISVNFFFRCLFGFRFSLGDSFFGSGPLRARKFLPSMKT
jgi:hypothetical protein